MAHRAAMERELRGNMLAVRRARAEEEAAARDAQAAAWGDPWGRSRRARVAGRRRRRARVANRGDAPGRRRAESVAARC